MAKTLHIPKIFFGFLTASFLMWMLINLSKKYTSKIVYAIEYKDLPQNKILQEEPLEKISVTVEGSGFNLFAASFSTKKIFLSLDKLVKKADNDFYLLTSSQEEQIQKRLNSGLSLVKVNRDSIYFKLGTLASKKVPVKLDLNLNYKLGYGMESINLNEDSILLSGPELQLNKIEYIKTKQLTLQEISEDVNVDLNIELPKEATGVKLNLEKVKAEILVDKFTEGSFEVPIKIVGIPKGTELNTFPKKVKVIFKVGLKNYQKITEDLFEIVCDYKRTKKDNLQYLVPEIKNRPELISSVRITPQRIDFLIRK
ncbi:YbbR-like domain-containing protein [uncultured Tenacibaculum sp.]|uniref:CdaR family protein n=1 Tax=uncultured Tenacibaculum sp. TaxID=174713 RepID=UPI0026017B9C|nr:YbbR-like domain-containing protein [uncultured Tenacibaculum sp.]